MQDSHNFEGEGEELGIAIADKDEEPELRWFLPDSFAKGQIISE